MVRRERRLNREDAQAHWEYTAKIIAECMKLARTAYIEGMLHGYKHGKEEGTAKCVLR